MPSDLTQSCTIPLPLWIFPRTHIALRCFGRVVASSFAAVDLTPPHAILVATDATLRNLKISEKKKYLQFSILRSMWTWNFPTKCDSSIQTELLHASTVRQIEEFTIRAFHIFTVSGPTCLQFVITCKPDYTTVFMSGIHVSPCVCFY